MHKPAEAAAAAGEFAVHPEARSAVDSAVRSPVVAAAAAGLAAVEAAGQGCRFALGPGAWVSCGVADHPPERRRGSDLASLMDLSPLQPGRDNPGTSGNPSDHAASSGGDSEV